jgi:hypothetical protein
MLPKAREIMFRWNVSVKCECFIDLKIEMLNQKKSIVLGRLVRIRCPEPQLV